MASKKSTWPGKVISLFGNSNVLIFGWVLIIRHWDMFITLLGQYINLQILLDFLKVALTIFISLQVWRYVSGLQQCISLSEESWAKPMFLPCRTAHTRFFPTKHSFSYSYLMVGIPVGWKGNVGGMLSIDNGKKSSSWCSKLFSWEPWSAWYTVNGDDYLDRGPGDGLEGKLRVYLQNQGITPETYPYAYLTTAAKFLNYSSNPVSIWYLYSSSKELSAMILEVNNTFDERHIYFLQSSSSETPKPTKFSQTWRKDFYVSVFNSRKGSYSLNAYDPFTLSQSSKYSMINTTITLLSSENYPKLTARIFRTSPPLDPRTMSLGQKTHFLLSWWWVGLATFPRTIIQAVYILKREKLPWVFRPEPLARTLSRRANETELFLETLFRKYLRHLVENAELPVVMRYKASGIPDCEEEVIYSASAQIVKDEVIECEVKVLTPTFYSAWVRFADAVEGVRSEVGNRTISADIEGLEWLFLFQDYQTIKAPLLFRLLQNLRIKPSPSLSSSTIPISQPTITPISPFDAFILSHTDPSTRNEYRWRMLRLLISDIVAFGMLELLDAELWLAKRVAFWWVAGWVRRS